MYARRWEENALIDRSAKATSCATSASNFAATARGLDPMNELCMWTKAQVEE